jgi:hypothetical protein
MDKIKMIKKDAVIDLKVGTGFIQKLQKVLMQVAADLTPEQLEQYKKEAVSVSNGEDFTEDWMDTLTTISLLIREIETEADKQGHTYEGSIEDIMPKES